MNSRARKQRPIAEINITPFTDVILVLLVIFMIATPLLLQPSIKVNLPRAGSAKITEDTDKADITITNKGLIYLDGASVTKKELVEKIEARYNDNHELKIILFSDKLTRFKDIAMVLDEINRLGIRNINIAAKKDPGDR